MDRRDRELLARMAKINHEYGGIVLHLLSLHHDDAEFAAGLRQLGEAHTSLGKELIGRADELTTELGRQLPPGDTPP